MGSSANFTSTNFKINSTKSKAANFDFLPNELLFKIFIECECVLSLRQACHHFKSIIDELILIPNTLPIVKEYKFNYTENLFKHIDICDKIKGLGGDNYYYNIIKLRIEEYFKLKFYITISNEVDPETDYPKCIKMHNLDGGLEINLCIFKILDAISRLGNEYHYEHLNGIIQYFKNDIVGMIKSYGYLNEDIITESVNVLKDNVNLILEMHNYFTGKKYFRHATTLIENYHEYTTRRIFDNFEYMSPYVFVRVEEYAKYINTMIKYGYTTKEEFVKYYISKERIKNSVILFPHVVIDVNFVYNESTLLNNIVSMFDNFKGIRLKNALYTIIDYILPEIILNEDFDPKLHNQLSSFNNLIQRIANEKRRIYKSTTQTEYFNDIMLMYSNYIINYIEN